MRWMIAALALAGAAACDGATTTSDSGNQGAAPEGYTMEVRADASQQTYLISAPDGRIVGAQSADNASALMDTSRARNLFGQPPPPMDEQPNVLSLRVPGFDLSIGGVTNGENGDGKGGDLDQGQVHLSVGGEHGQRVEVRADEGGPGDEDDRAYVRITGANEQAVREFLDDAEDLSPEVKAQMLTGLGLQ